MAASISLPARADKPAVPLTDPGELRSCPPPIRPVTKAERTDFSEEIHGVKVADPYRWMENIDSAKTQAWIAGQRNKTERWMINAAGRGKIRAHLDDLQNYARFSRPYCESGKYFYAKNTGLQNQDCVYMSDSPDKEGKLILDPNTLSKDGTVALTRYAISPGAKYMAYSLASSGSDWNTIKVIDLESGQALEDTVSWVKFSTIVWNKDGSGFYYSRYPAPEKSSETLGGVNAGHTLCFHKLNTAQKQDKIVFANPDNPDLSVYGGSDDDHEWLIIEASHSRDDNTAILAKRMDDPNSQFITLPEAFKGQFSFVDIKDGKLLAMSDFQAPNRRLLSIKLTENIIDAPWEEVVPEAKDTLSGVSCVGGKIYANYLHDACSKVLEYDAGGKLLKEVRLPGLGSVSSFSGKQKDKTAYYTYTSFNTPAVIYAYDTESGESNIWHKPNLSFNPDDFKTEQVFVDSNDGARVPLFISFRKDVKPNGDIPTLLYGYGGFAINMTPGFSTRTMTWMQMGGIYAEACLRGGAEYGEKWHEAGTKTQKQHTFDDFINCARYLIDHNYTKPSRLAINGGSNGGLLVGACLNQRPDLFGAAVPQVGVMDMLRFSKFTIGRYWTADYGDVDKKDEFEALYKISPYHNIKDGTKYPPTLITTADHDDRVFPAHSFKYAAALQHAQGGDAPILIRIESKAGHGAGKPIRKRLDENADILSFIATALGLKEVNFK